MSAVSTISEHIEAAIDAETSKHGSCSGNNLETPRSDEVKECSALEIEETSIDSVIEEKLSDLTRNSSSEGDKEVSVQDNACVDSDETKRQAIEKFSSEEADKIIKEAILIKHVLDDDKTQFTTSTKAVVDNIAYEKGSNGGYDRYIIDKFLRSEPDPSEITFEGFEDPSGSELRDDIKLGEEDDMGEAKDEDEFGVDSVQTETQTDRTLSSQSILQKEFDLTEAFGENALQTIDENQELTLHEDIVKEPHETDEIEEMLQDTVDEAESKDPETVTHTDADNEQIMEEVMMEVATEDAETSEEEEDIGEMTYKQKKAVVAAVRQGNIDLLEDLLDKRHADIDMLWYNENLIMVAIRAGQEQMAEFLIDNGVDVNHTTKLIERTEKGEITTYTQTCREMAIDKNLMDLAELIDYKTDNLFSFIKPKQREIRIRRPRPPTPPTPEEESEDDDFSTESGSQVHDGMGEMDDSVLTKAKLQKFERDLDSGLNSSNNAELERKISLIKSDRVHSESHAHSGSDSRRESVDNSSHVSHVFGMDEGYETMSPVSPMCGRHPSHPEHTLHGARENVSIRGTRASHSAKMFTFKTLSKTNRSQNDNVVHNMNPVGCYTRESRRWHQTKSAPTMRTRQSYESIPEVVRTGAPFAHGDKKFAQHPNVKNFHSSVISPYSQVAKMLAGSRLLKPKSASSLPSIHNERTIRADRPPIRTETYYIYADRNSASVHDRISFIHQPRVSTAGSGIGRPRKAW